MVPARSFWSSGVVLTAVLLASLAGAGAANAGTESPPAAWDPMHHGVAQGPDIGLTSIRTFHRTDRSETPTRYGVSGIGMLTMSCRVPDVKHIGRWRYVPCWHQRVEYKLRFARTCTGVVGEVYSRLTIRRLRSGPWREVDSYDGAVTWGCASHHGGHKLFGP